MHTRRLMSSLSVALILCLCSSAVIRAQGMRVSLILRYPFFLTAHAIITFCPFIRNLTVTGKYIVASTKFEKPSLTWHVVCRLQWHPIRASSPRTLDGWRLESGKESGKGCKRRCGEGNHLYSIACICWIYITYIEDIPFFKSD